MRTALDQLVEWSRQLAVLQSCAAVLSWDEQTYMPRQGSAHRGEQLALLAGLRHAQATDPRVGDWLQAAEEELSGASEPEIQRGNLREWRRRYRRDCLLPRTLVEELARTTSLAQHEWAEARAANRFAAFAPRLTQVFELKRQEATCLAEGGDLYGALLDEFEPGMRTEAVALLLAQVRTGVAGLCAEVVQRGAQPASRLVGRRFPVERQRVLGEMVAAAVGFDFNKGRLDTTAHPFCSGIGPGDCRITTRYRETDLADALFSTLHEVGHALYEQGLDPAWYGTPAGEAVSLGLHESQSRLWENLVGRGAGFWSRWYPIARGLLRESLSGIDQERFVREINRVEPSLIRVDADEVTYNLHIVIRFELERGLLEGSLAVADLPAAWNQSYQQLLGICPPDDARGCLQDIHWSAGLVGYFPTYTLGNVFAAQLFEAAQRALGDLEPQFERGETAGLLGWLREKIHRRGSAVPAAELIRQATGEEPEPTPLLTGMRRRLERLETI